MSVRLEDVAYRYPAGVEPALRSVTLECRPGELTLVSGRLGAGTSTLLLVMAGLAPRLAGGERSGVVELLGHDPATAVGREALLGRVGLLFSTPWTQLSGMAYTVRDEVAFGPANLGWSRERIRAAVTRELERFEVAHLAGRDPRTLSGGELQRVMLAGVLAMEPDVLLLDEPAAELDPPNAERVYALLPALAVERTVVLGSSDVDRAVSIADRVVLLEDGRVAADGVPHEVLSEERWTASRMSTTVAEVVCQAGCAAPFPLTVDEAVRRFG